MKSNKLLSKNTIRFMGVLAFFCLASPVYASNLASVCSPTEFVPAGAKFELVGPSDSLTFSPVELKPTTSYIINKSIHVFDIPASSSSNQYSLNKRTKLTGLADNAPIDFRIHKVTAPSSQDKSKTKDQWLFKFTHREDGQSGYVSVPEKEISQLPLTLALSSTPLDLPAGTKISSAGQGRTQVHAIPHEVGSSLALTLAQAKHMTRVSETSHSNRLSFVSPQKATSGASIKLNVQNDMIDFKGLRIEICAKNKSGKFEWLKSEITDSASRNINFQFKLPHDFLTWSSEKLDVRLSVWKGNKLMFIEEVNMPFHDKLQPLMTSLLIVLLVTLATSLLMAENQNPLSIKNWDPRILWKGRTGNTSLSQCQTLGWSLVVILSILYMWLASGELPDLDQELFMLFGISLLASAGATGAAIKKGKLNDTPQPVSHSQAKTSEGNAPVTQSENILRRDNYPQLLRLQLLVFTLLTWSYVLWKVWENQQIPELPAFLLALSGLSNAGYLSTKLMGIRSPSTAAVKQLVTDVGPSQISQVQKTLNIPQTGKQDTETTNIVSQYQKMNGMKPSDGLITSALAQHVSKRAGIP